MNAIQEQPEQDWYLILVVDDEMAFCNVVCEILNELGYEARYALNARQALEVLNHAAPDLILADVMMPDMDGLSFVRNLRQQPQWVATPMAIVSAKATSEDRQAALDSGATAFLAKPFSAQDLEVLVKELLNHPTG